jgi:predicted transcriptional regulator YdeE
MSYEIVTHDGFTIVGPSIITENSKAAEDLTKFWNKIFEKNILMAIPNGTGEHVYGVYSDYETDHTASYSVTGGVQVTEVSPDLPDGMKAREIPEGTYALFIAKKPEDIGEVWSDIWEADLKRTFKFDFEQYGAENGEIHIFVGIEDQDDEDEIEESDEE